MIIINNTITNNNNSKLIFKSERYKKKDRVKRNVSIYVV